MKINHSAAGWYWFCFTCSKRGRPADNRETAVKRGEVHLAAHRR